jgi:hypothetical protein
MNACFLQYLAVRPPHSTILRKAFQWGDAFSRYPYPIAAKIFMILRRSQNKGGKKRKNPSEGKKNNLKTDEAFCVHRRSLQEKKGRNKEKERTEKRAVGK